MHIYLKTSYYAANVGKVARTLKQSSAWNEIFFKRDLIFSQDISSLLFTKLDRLGTENYMILEPL